MRIRGLCAEHNQPLGISSPRIIFPTGIDDVPSQAPDGWLDLDQSEMFCPDQTPDCTQSWTWQTQSR